MDWKKLSIDERMIKALRDLNYEKPTSVQMKSIPKGLEGKDLFITAATGSGKTYAVLVPTVQKVLNNQENEIQCIYFIPSLELGEQVKTSLDKLLKYCKNYISYFHLSEVISKEERKKKLKEKPKILITTPHNFSTYSSSLNLKSVDTIIVDEADFTLQNMNEIFKIFKGNYQTMMISATLNIKEHYFLKNPVIIEDKTKASIKEYYIKFNSNELVERLLSLYFLTLKYKRMIVYTNHPKHTALIQMVLSGMEVNHTAMLCRHYPFLSRFDIIEKFNSKKINYLISDVFYEKSRNKLNFNIKSRQDLKNKQIELDQIDLENYTHLSRGLDYNGVECVILFEIPISIEDYIHQIGRTGRSSMEGESILFKTFKTSPTWEEIIKREIKEIKRNEKEENFRYRIQDVFEKSEGKHRGFLFKEVKKEIENALAIKNLNKTIVHGYQKKKETPLPDYLFE